MLVLSRKMNERVMIDDEVVVTVVEVRGDSVKLAFSAPKDVAIHREEVYRLIKSDTANELVV